MYRLTSSVKPVALASALLLGSFNVYAVGTFQSITSEGVSVEAASTGALSANISGDAIVIVNGTNYPTGAGARLTISLTGGATFADTSYTLEQSLGGAGTGDLTEWSMEGVNPVGLTEVKFILAASHSGAGLAPGSDFILSGSTVAGQPINFTLPALSSGGELDIEAVYQDSPTTTVESYTAAELFQYANEFSASVDTIADAIVDVNDNRLTFTGGVASDTVALEFTKAAATNTLSLNDNDLVDIVLSGDMSDVASVGVTTDAASRGNMTIDTSANTASISLSASDAFAAGSTVLTVTTTGSSALATRSFTVQADANFETETDKNMVAEATAAGSWTINGLQAKVSHLSLNASGFISWLKIVNEGTTVAEVTADIVWTLADGTEGSVSGASLGTADAGGVATISEATILSAIGEPTQLADVSMTVTVAGQVNLVHLVAEKKADDGRLPIPVYYNLGGANPRTWVN